MKTIKINGNDVEFSDEKNLLEVIRKTGIQLPTFCYHSELSVYGACRMCLVEEMQKGLVAACATPPAEWMEIKTHTLRLQRQRKNTLELYLAEHDRDCTSCYKNQDCKLQELAQNMGIDEVRFGEMDKQLPIDDSSSAIVRDPNKCILCGDCVRMCEEVQGLGVIGFAYRGSKTVVTPAFNKDTNEVDCIDCGQCASVCPTGSIVVKSETEKVWEAVNNDDKVVVAQIAPAVRVAFGEAFGLDSGESIENLVVSAAKTMGIDKVFDTCFAADLTVMEETKEFEERIEKGEKLPQFTSCCPGWVKYAELKHPQMIDNLSSCKSPQQMFGSFAKNYYAKELGVPREDVYVVSIMPCTAKKSEAEREEFQVDGDQDVNAVITTQELVRMVKKMGIVFEDLEEEPFDMPFGFATGSGIIFGATGGVAESVVRNIADEVKQFNEVRGLDGIKEASIKKDDRELKLAVVSGIQNVKDLLEKIENGEAHYDLIEVMACPGGCVGGAGQPLPNDATKRKERAEGLYNNDNKMQLIRAKENPMINKLYEKWLKAPGSSKAHKVLHTEYSPRRRIESDSIKLANEKGQLNIKVCIGTSCHLNGSYDIVKAVDNKIKENELEDKVNLEGTFCLENCQGSPSVEVNGEVIGKATKEKVCNLIDEIV